MEVLSDILEYLSNTTMKETINILCAADNKYIPYCGIMLTSVFENNKDADVHAYVLIDEPLSKKNRVKMDCLANRYKQTIHFVTVDNSMLQQYPTKDMPYWSIAMYYRLFAADLLPNIDKILYFDCDIIVTGSLKGLYNIDLKDKAVTAAEDIFTYTDIRQNTLGYPVNAGYFNSGVLLMNLTFWRKHNICRQCFHFLSQNYDKLSANDQDVLNAVLWDKRERLPLIYNYQLQFLSKYFFDLQNDEMRKEVLDSYSKAVVIHYAYAIKPWSILFYKKPFFKEWEYYKNISPWAHIRRTLPDRKPINNIIKRFIMWPLGLMKYDSGFIK